MSDLALAVTVVLAALVVLVIPEFFWKFFTVLFIGGFSILSVYILRELTQAAPLVALSFLAGAALSAVVLGFRGKPA